MKKAKTTKGPKHPGPKFKRDEILAMLKRHNGNVRHVAAEAGVPPMSIYRRIHAENLFDEVKAIRRDADARIEAEELARARSAFRVALSGGDTSAMLRATIAIVDLNDDADGWANMTPEDRGLYIARRMAEMAEIVVNEEG
jgi:hypothetical protein